MSDKWPEDSNEVPVLKFLDRESHLYQAAFPHIWRVYVVRLLESGEPYWYERIKGHFLYPLLQPSPILPLQPKSNLEDYIVGSDSLEGLSYIDEKKASAAGSKSSGSAGSRIPEAGATPSSISLDEEEEEEEHEEPAA
ncbi:hypothetical protein Hanom_Chr13g01209331 [Helianthus anomalus]